MKRLGVLLLLLLFLFMSSPSLSGDGKAIECEVMETAEVVKGCGLQGTHLLLIHHARENERAELSKMLKAFSGKQTEFTVGHTHYRGVIFRLSHCFGRGLLLYRGDIKVEKGETILVEFPGPK